MMEDHGHNAHNKSVGVNTIAGTTLIPGPNDASEGHLERVVNCAISLDNSIGGLESSITLANGEAEVGDDCSGIAGSMPPFGVVWSTLPDDMQRYSSRIQKCCHDMECLFFGPSTPQVPEQCEADLPKPDGRLLDVSMAGDNLIESLHRLQRLCLQYAEESCFSPEFEKALCSESTNPADPNIPKATNRSFKKTWLGIPLIMNQCAEAVSSANAIFISAVYGK